MSTIISISSTKAISVRTIEPKVQLSTKFLSIRKELEEEIDLDEKIIILNWDISELTSNQMQLFGELLQKKAKQYKLKEERDKEFKIIEDAKNILVEVISIEIDSSKIILY